MQHFTRHKLLNLHLSEHLLKHLLNSILPIPMYGDHVLDDTVLIVRKCVDVLLVTTESLDIALVVLGALV